MKLKQLALTAIIATGSLAVAVPALAAPVGPTCFVKQQAYNQTDQALDNGIRSFFQQIQPVRPIFPVYISLVKGAKPLFKADAMVDRPACGRP